MEKKKITPKQISEVLRLVNNTLDGIDNGIRHLINFRHRIPNIEYLLNLLEKEKNKLNEQLEIFNNTDVEELKNMMYDKEFNNLIQNKLYGTNDIEKEE